MKQAAIVGKVRKSVLGTWLRFCFTFVIGLQNELTGRLKNSRFERAIEAVENGRLSRRSIIMRKQLTLLILLAALVSTASAQNWFKGSLDEALAKAKSENKKVFIDFFSPT